MIVLFQQSTQLSIPMKKMNVGDPKASMLYVFIDLFLYDLYESTSIKFMLTEVDVTL
jgi:hypothetical protein